MVIQLDLTEKMIGSFNDCTKKGNYEPFVRDNQQFITSLSKHLKKVQFHQDQTISDVVSKDSKFCFDYLTKWNPRAPGDIVPGTNNLEKYTKGFVKTLKEAISTRNWDHFYSKYAPTADFMIEEAREQGIFDFQIQCGSGSFDTFEDRDLAQSYNQFCAPVHQEKPTDTRNDRSMILLEGEAAEKYCAENRNIFPVTQVEPRQEVPSFGQYVTNIPIQTETPPAVQMRGVYNVSGYQAREQHETLSSHVQSTNQKLLPTQRNLNFIDNSQKVFITGNQEGKHGEAVPRQDNLFYDNHRTLPNHSNSVPKNHSMWDALPKVADHSGHGYNLRSRNGQNHQSPGISLHPELNLQHQQWDTLDPGLQSSAEQELKSLRRPESFHNPSDVYTPTREIAKYQDDLEKSTEIRPQIKYESERNSPQPSMDSFRERSLCRDSPIDNSAFDRELAQQKMKNAFELEMKKNERKKKQKEFEDELQKLKEESKARFEMLLKCILARHRFEIQEENWKDWIHGCRQNVIQLLNRFSDFVDEIEREQKGLRRPGLVDHLELQASTNHLLNSIMVTYNILQFDFEKLEYIEKSYPDAMFVRVLKKCIASVAEELLEIYSTAENLGSDQASYSNLQWKLSKLKPDLIYSTNQLRSVCKTAYPSQYQNIVFPLFNQSVKIQELR